VIDDRRFEKNSSLSKWTLEDAPKFKELEVVLVHGTKAYKGRGTAALIHKLCTRIKMTGSFTLQPLYPWRKKPGTH
jgi:hypothetical protein